jgi:hypothetical protein
MPDIFAGLDQKFGREKRLFLRAQTLRERFFEEPDMLPLFKESKAFPNDLAGSAVTPSFDLSPNKVPLGWRNGDIDSLAITHRRNMA